MTSEHFNAPAPEGGAATEAGDGSAAQTGQSAFGALGSLGGAGNGNSTAAPAMAASPSATASSATAPSGTNEERLAALQREQQAEQTLRWQSQVSQWRKEVAADPTLGGDNLAASVARAQLALDRFDQDKSIGRLLEESGYGNHPAVVRFFNRMADTLMEDSLPLGQADGGRPPLEERMYAGWSSIR